MHIGSFFCSFLLHLAILILVLLWPAAPPVNRNRPIYQVSLVMGDRGGENLSAPVLGSRPVPAASPEPGIPVSLPAAPPDSPPVPSPVSVPVQTVAAPVPMPEPVALASAMPKPQPPQPPHPVLPTPEPVAPAPQPAPPKPAPPKPAPPKPAPPKPTPPRPVPPRQPARNRNSVADALDQAQRQAQGNAASRALAELRHNADGSGGGGGQGSGPGGGGLYDVYAGLVILAVQPNWSMPQYSRENLVVQVRIKLDQTGTVLDCSIERSSGRADFDASAVNAVLRTKVLPAPPTPAQQDLVISFNLLEMAGR